jgi:hypothetical protein
MFIIAETLDIILVVLVNLDKVTTIVEFGNTNRLIVRA